MFVTVFTFVTVFQLLIALKFDNSTFSKIQCAYSSEMSKIAFYKVQFLFPISISLIVSFK